ncbi:MAG: hypothetical protein AB7V50_08670 [Vampirovibrionia bacterium]
MNKLLSDNINKEKQDFSYIKENKFLSDPNLRKSFATRNAKGSSFLEGINLPEAFFISSYDLADSNKS